MSEFDESENERDSDWEETDSIASYVSEDIDETVKKNQLLGQKLKIVLRYNADAIDIDHFNKLIKDINRQLDSIKFITEFSNSDLVNKEYSFMQILEVYISRIRHGEQPHFLNDTQINALNVLYSEINASLEGLFAEETNDEPLETQSLDALFEILIEKEMDYLKTIVKDINKKIPAYAGVFKKEKIIIPIRKNYATEENYKKAYSEFYRNISKYISSQHIVQHMNVTSIGSSYKHYEKSLRDQYLESIKLYNQLAIKVSAKDNLFAKKNSLLKSIMLKMSEDKLIKCAIEAEVYQVIENKETIKPFEFSPITLEKIRKYFDKAQISTNSSNSKGTINLPVITQTLRNVSVKNLLKEFNNINLMKHLEIEIYSLSGNNFTDYTSKINDILFILRNYPNFKKFLIEEKISVNQLALFEKEIAFETLVNITSIKNRRSTVKYIKSVLIKHTNFTPNLINYKCNILSKRFELLIYDISKNDKIYNLYVKRLIDFIKQNNILKLSVEEILLMLKSEKIKYKKEDYSKLNKLDINALISQEKVKLSELKEKINIAQKDILTWIPPLKILSREREKWKIFLKNGKLNELIGYRNFLLQKYSLPEDLRLLELKEKVLKLNKKCDNLKTQLIKINQKEEENQQFSTIDIIKPTFNQITFTRNKSLIKEVIQAYKRKLITDSVHISQDYKNRLNDLMELVDLNNISNRNVIIQRKIFADITRLLPPGYIFEDLNKFYYTRSIEGIAAYAKIPPNMLEKLTFKFKFTPGENKTIIGFYGEDLINKLYHTTSPDNFYSKSVHKNYFELNKKSQIAPVLEYRRLRVLYDPYTGKFGHEAFNGYLFDVEKLSMGNDGKPLEDFTHYESIDPRTNEMKYKTVKVPVPGKVPFIKVPILTNKKGEQKYVWIRVEQSKPKMYTSTYDSCNRYTSEKECNSGKGIGNSNCLYNKLNSTCNSEYNQIKQINSLFGKVKIPLKKILKKKLK